MTTEPPPLSGTTAKRKAILDSALVIFARDGYARASIDTIAETAAVSTRTIYNHFADKAGLFAAVVTESATAVSAAHVEQVDSILGSINSAADLEERLVQCGIALQTIVSPDAPHWALVQHIQADAQNIPAEVMDTWRRLGPARTKRQIALHFAELAQRGLLKLDDPFTAAVHYSALASSTWTSSVEPAPSVARATELTRLAVAAFLRGYAPRA